MLFFIAAIIIVIGIVLAMTLNHPASSKTLQNEIPPDLKGKSVPTSLPVKAKEQFFSAAEREFYETLKKALPEEYVAFPNVRLQDIFYISAKGEERRGVYARFQDKHVDFLVVTRDGYRPILGIELDGKSHDSKEQQYRDAVKEVVFKSGGMALLRFRNNDHPSVVELQEFLQTYL